jgi:RNA polymerase sigma-70 factor (ECF subfamily)
MDFSDKQLIDKYFKGDEKSLEILIKRYLKPIYSFVYRHIGNSQDAEDITQDVFVKTWRNLKKFDKNRSFKTWIFTIAKNSYIDFLRKKKAIPFSDFENDKGENIIINKLSYQMADEQEFSSIINRLPSKYRNVMLLYYNNYFTFREIAERLKTPLNTIKSQHRRALAFLHQNIGFHRINR